MSTLIQDLRYAGRTLLKSPGFTTGAVLTLALGIGATTGMFAVVDGILLRSLPYPEPDRLVRVWPASTEGAYEKGGLSQPDFADWRERNTVFSSLGAYFGSTLNLTGHGEPAALTSVYVSEDFFATLGMAALLGRVVAEEEIVQGGRRVVVLSHGLWQSRFGGSASVVGASLALDGAPYTVVGVMPPEFRFPYADTDLWTPVSLITEDMIPRSRRGVRWLSVVGRLAEDVPLDRSRAEMNAITARLAEEYPESNAGRDHATMIELQETIVGEVAPALLVALAAVLFVLLMVCANLANLLLVRASARSKEMALRAALGAGRIRLARQLFAESLLLSVLGGVSGVLLAVWGVGSIRALIAPILPRTEDLAVDVRVLGFALVVSLLTGLIFGIFPALRGTRPELQAALTQGWRGTTGGDPPRLRAALVVGQVALAVVLTVGAGLMLKNLYLLRGVDPGFDPAGVLAVRMQLATRPAAEGHDVDASFESRKDEILERLRALNGAVAVAAVNKLPLEGGGEAIPISDEAGPDAREVDLWAELRPVSGGYFRVMGIPLLRGEVFPDRVVEGSPGTAVISEATARRFWPGENPVGRTLYLGDSANRVIGVVADVRRAELTEEPWPTVYVHQSREQRVGVTFVIRTLGDPLRLAAPAREAIRSVDADQPIGSIFPLTDVLSESIARERLLTLLLGTYGVVALLLAALGLFGVLAYTVKRQTREIGVRMALGAHPADVLRMVIGRGVLLVALGVALGMATALGLTRLLSGLVSLVSTTDPWTYGTVTLLLLLTALLAGYLPARRAARVDPVVALRSE